MSVITLVEPQKKNPERFNVFIDGEFAFGASSDVIVSERLIKGKTISPAELEKILSETVIGNLLEKVYRFLSFRSRSSKEVRDYLAKLSYRRTFQGEEKISPVVSDLIIKRLTKNGLIDDLEFARAWTESRRNRLKGKIVINQELFEKGISREIIETVMSDETDEQTLASLALEKKAKAFRSVPESDLFRKSLEFLLRRGFSYQIAKAAVEKLIKKS